VVLTVVFIQHYVFHRGFVYQLMFGVSVFGPLVLSRCMDEAAQRRRSRAQQQASNVEERDASGG
jgi:hypothetical protein